MGLERLEAEEAEAGDIVAITGIEDLGISEPSARSTPRKRCPR